jgi:hypothetical protein
LETGFCGKKNISTKFKNRTERRWMFWNNEEERLSLRCGELRPAEGEMESLEL